MIHQLHCLDIIREEMFRERHEDSTEPSPLSRHCLNYVKQMVLCHGDVQLEPKQYPNGTEAAAIDQIYECRDWIAVYDKVKESQAEHAKWRGDLQS